MKAKETAKIVLILSSQEDGWLNGSFLNRATMVPSISPLESQYLTSKFFPFSIGSIVVCIL